MFLIKSRAVMGAGAPLSAAPLSPPQGRLTLTSGTPVLTATVSAAGTVFYTPYVGATVPIYNGSGWVQRSFSELSNVLANSATGNAGPAAAANNSNYDLFVWDNAGTLTLTRGPAWTSDTARGTGAGTSELQLVNGLYTNKVAITNGPAANRGIYLGTIRTNGTATTDFNVGSSAAGGGQGIIGVWNCYNRVNVAAQVVDSTFSYTYTSNVVQPANNNTNNRVSFIVGLIEDEVQALNRVRVTTTAAAGAFAIVGIGLDSTTSFGLTGVVFQAAAAAATTCSLVSNYEGYPGLGFHFLQKLEQGDNTHANTFNDTSGYNAFNVRLRA